MANEGLVRSGGNAFGLKLADEMLERAATYRTLGRLFYRPLSEKDLEGMGTETFRHLSEESANTLVAEGYNDIYRYLRRRNTATCQDLGADFTQTFCGIREYRGVSAVPYESLYLSPEGELMGHARLEVFRIYKSHRIKLNEGVDIPEDHLSFEFEFMAVLSERCAQAVARGDMEDALRQAADQEDFLVQHILKWFGRFFNLSNKIVQTRFYQGVLKVAKGFLSEDAVALKGWLQRAGETAAPAVMLDSTEHST